MRQILGYTLMLLRAYRRDRVALFFGFFFPLIFMGLFGILGCRTTAAENQKIRRRPSPAAGNCLIACAHDDLPGS